jgi:hypothetical protein
VVVGLTGQQGLIKKLKASHESSTRVFSVLDLKPLSHDENKAVVRLDPMNIGGFCRQWQIIRISG